MPTKTELEAQIDDLHEVLSGVIAGVENESLEPEDRLEQVSDTVLGYYGEEEEDD